MSKTKHIIILIITCSLTFFVGRAISRHNKTMAAGNKQLVTEPATVVKTDEQLHKEELLVNDPIIERYVSEVAQLQKDDYVAVREHGNRPRSFKVTDANPAAADVIVVEVGKPQPQTILLGKGFKAAVQQRDLERDFTFIRREKHEGIWKAHRDGVEKP